MVNNVVSSLLHEEYVVRTCVFCDNNMTCLKLGRTLRERSKILRTEAYLLPLQL
jgi:hypothetical protein